MQIVLWWFQNDFYNAVLKLLQYSLHFHEIFLGQIYKNSTIMHVRQILSDSFQYDNDSKLVPKLLWKYLSHSHYQLVSIRCKCLCLSQKYIIYFNSSVNSFFKTQKSAIHYKLQPESHQITIPHAWP